MEAKTKRGRKSKVRAQNAAGVQQKQTAGPKTAKNERLQTKPPIMPLLIAGREVVGREVSVFKEAKQKWLNGCVQGFKEREVLHQIVYQLPFPEDLKNSESIDEEEWLCLAKSIFLWGKNSWMRLRHANPTYSKRFTPKGEKAVGQRVRVFWPAMGKWYQGKVVAFDSSTGQHKVTFKDGDSKSYSLPHEAMVWLDIPQLCSDAAIMKTRAEEGDIPIPEVVIGNDENKPPAQTAAANGVGKDRGKVRKYKKDVAPCAKKVTRNKAAAQSDKDTAKTDTAKTAPAPKRVAKNQTKGDKALESKKSAENKKSSERQKLSEGKKGVLKKDQGTKKPDSRKTAEGKKVAAKSQSGRAKSPVGRPTASKGRAAQSKKSEARGAGDTNLKSPASCKKVQEGRAAENSAAQVPKDDQSTKLQSWEGSQVAVTVECGPGDQAKDKVKGALMRASPANPRKRSRAPELVNSNNKLSEDGPPTKQRATSKLSRGSMKLGQKSRLSQQASRLSRSTSGLAEHLEAIKGSRIGVWWSNDKCYYKGTVASFDVNSRSLTVKYDDGVTEKPRIENLRFKWLLPKARTAGASDLVHAAFFNLGAINATGPCRPDARQSAAVEVVDVPVKMEKTGEVKGLHPARPSPESPRIAADSVAVSSVQATPERPTQAQNSVQNCHSATRPVLGTVQEPAVLGASGGTPKLGNTSDTSGRHLDSLEPSTGTAPGLMPFMHAVVNPASGCENSPVSASGQTSVSPSPALVTSPAGAASYRKSNKDIPQSSIPEGSAAEGWEVSLKFRGNGCVFQGRVLAFDKARDKYRVLWQDGEDEWLDRNDPDLTWSKDCKKCSGFATGPSEDSESPSNEDLVGWRISVWWPTEGDFFEGVVESNDAELNQHQIAYADGEVRFETLPAEIYKCVLQPEVKAIRPRGRRQSNETDADDNNNAPRPRKKRRGSPEDDSDEDEPMLCKARVMKSVPSNLNLRLSLGYGSGIRRMDSGRGTLLVYNGDEALNSPMYSPLSPQVSQGFGLIGQSSQRMDSRGPPAYVKNVNGLKSAEGFRVGVKRVRIFLSEQTNAPKMPSQLRSSQPQSADGVHETAKRGLVAVNSLHSRQSAESELASLKLMAQRVEQATNNIRNGMPIESNEALPRGLSNLPSLASTLLPQNLAPQISSLPLLTSGDDLDSNAPSRTLLPIRPTPTTPLNQRVSAAEKQAPSSELTLMVKKSEETEDASLRSEPSDVLLSSRNPAVAENLTPPPSPFSGFKEPSNVSTLCPDLISTLADEFAGEHQNSMTLPQTPSINFEAMIRAPSRTGSMGSNHNQSPGRIESDCRPPLDSQKDRPDLVKSH